MTDEGKARFSIVNEVDQVVEALDEILDNIDRINVKNWDKIAERLYFSKLNANRALALLKGDEDQ